MCRHAPTLRVSPPEELWEEPYVDVARPGARQYHVAPDGRFLMIRQGAATDDATTSPKLVVVLNWFEELKVRVPVNCAQRRVVRVRDWR